MKINNPFSQQIVASSMGNTLANCRPVSGPGATASSTIGFTFVALAAQRSWEIKVTQLECGNAMTPPDGCLQYHTGTAGQLTTFNYAGNALHLADQDYNICIRQEMGKTVNN